MAINTQTFSIFKAKKGYSEKTNDCQPCIEVLSDISIWFVAWEHRVIDYSEIGTEWNVWEQAWSSVSFADTSTRLQSIATNIVCYPSGVVLLLVAAMIKVKIDFVNTSIPFCQGRLTNASRPERVT